MSDRGGKAADPPLLKAVELLEDGQWHLLEPVLAEIGKVVPPGKALRFVEQRRAYTTVAEQRIRSVSQERLIAMGRRGIAMGTVNYKRRYFELTPASRGNRPDDTRMIRMLEVPPSVLRSRRLAESGRLIDGTLVDELLTDHDPVALLAQRFPGRHQLERTIVLLLDRLRDAEALAGPD